MSGESKREAARQRIVAKRAAEVAARAAEQRRRRTLIGGVLAAVVLVVVLVVVVVVQTRRTATASGAAAPANTVDNGYVFAVGPADAPATVDLYEDFQCPNCKALEDADGSTIDGLVAGGGVQVRYHGMAFLDTDANDDYSTRALNAAAVVADTAGTTAYQTFHDLLFAHQPAEGGSGLTDDQLIAYASQAGATAPDVAVDIRNLVYGQWVKAAEDRASKDGVTGTPTVFVNGKRLDAGQLTAAGITAAVTAAEQ